MEKHAGFLFREILVRDDGYFHEACNGDPYEEPSPCEPRCTCTEAEYGFVLEWPPEEMSQDRLLPEQAARLDLALGERRPVRMQCGGGYGVRKYTIVYVPGKRLRIGCVDLDEADTKEFERRWHQHFALETVDG